MTAVPPHFTLRVLFTLRGSSQQHKCVRSFPLTEDAVAGYAGMRPSPAPSKPQCPRRPPPGLHHPRLAVGDLTFPLLLIGVQV